MSATIQTDQNQPTPETDRIVAAASDLAKLAAAAEESPVGKADLQAQFDTYSHSSLVVGVASMIGLILSQQKISVDNTLLVVGVGITTTAIGYAWQWVSMKIRKPVTTITTGTKT